MNRVDKHFFAFVRRGGGTLDVMRFLVLLFLASTACADGYFAADWSPDGRWIAIGTEHSVRIEDATTRKLVREIPSRSTVHAVRFGARSDEILFSGKGNTFTIAGLDGRIRCKPDGINPVVGFSAARSRDGRTLLSVDEKNDLLVWTPPFAKPVRKLTGAGYAWKYALTPDGTRAFAVNREGRLTTWEVATGKRLAQFAAHAGYVFAMEMSADGRLLATGGSADDRTVALWDPTLLQLERRIRVGVIVRALAFSGDGKRIAVGGDKRRVDIYDTGTGKLATTVKGLRTVPSALDFSPDGRKLVVVTHRGDASIHEVAARK